MKTGIHPDYIETRVHCSCGNEFVTRSTRETLTAELCNDLDDDCQGDHLKKNRMAYSVSEAAHCE